MCFIDFILGFLSLLWCTVAKTYIENWMIVGFMHLEGQTEAEKVAGNERMIMESGKAQWNVPKLGL